MKAAKLLSIFFMCYFPLNAQNQTTVTIPAGTHIGEVLTPADLFYFPQFTKGKVFFVNGNKAEAKLNYSCLVDELHFIDQKADTLAVTNETTIKFISIDRDTFYYDQGYVRLIVGNNTAKLAHKLLWTVGNTGRIGAYGLVTPAGSTTALNSVNQRGRQYDLIVNEELNLKKVNRYYLGDQSNHFVPATKKHLLQLFPQKQSSIETYLRENKIEFNDREHLEKLIHFLGRIN